MPTSVHSVAPRTYGVLPSNRFNYWRKHYWKEAAPLRELPRAQLSSSATCEGVDGKACAGNGSRDRLGKICLACACTVPCRGVDGTGCPTISFRNGHDLLCKQCNAAKKGKHPTAPRSRPPAAIGKRSPYVCKKCGLLKKGHVCTVKE